MTAERPRTPRAIGDQIAAISVVGFGITIWALSADLPLPGSTGQVSGSLWPQILAGGLVILGTIWLVQCRMGRNATTENAPVNAEQRLPLAATLTLLIGTLLVWEFIGFIPAALVGSAVLSKVLGVRKWWRAVLWSSALTLAVWLLFAELLGVTL